MDVSDCQSQDDLILAQLNQAVRRADKYPKYASLHEGYAVLLEEVDEFWAEVKKKGIDRHPADLQAEIFDIMAVLYRIQRDIVGPMFSDKF